MDKNSLLYAGLAIVVIASLASALGTVVKVGLYILGMGLMLASIYRMGSERKSAAIEKAQAPSR